MSDQSATRTVQMPSKGGIGRRRLMQGAAAMAIAAPGLIRTARAASQVVIRSPGGVTAEALTKTISEPFMKATGIEVVQVPATIGKLFAMFRSGNVELDIVDVNQGVLLSLEKEGALDPINYAGWKFADPNEIDADVRKPYNCGHMYFSWVNTYNSAIFPGGKHPKNWSEFWDTKSFPGARSLPDLASGQPPIEFALLADGVPKDKLYPLDLDRAFKSLSVIRPAVKKFWDTGALSTELLTSNEVALSVVWNSQAQEAVDAKRGIEIEWAESMYTCQGRAVFKGAKNPDGAQQFIDFASQAKIQADFQSKLCNGPTNAKAISLMTPDIIAKLPATPERKAQGFALNLEWWEANRKEVSDRWSKWLLSR